jgi:hypothetical protein
MHSATKIVHIDIQCFKTQYNNLIHGFGHSIMHSLLSIDPLSVLTCFNINSNRRQRFKSTALTCSLSQTA